MNENAVMSVCLQLMPSPYLDALTKALIDGIGKSDPRIDHLIGKVNDLLDTVKDLTKTAADISIVVHAEEKHMAALDDSITQLSTDVSANTDAVTSAETLLNGIGKMVQDAVDAALAAGATPAQLASITDVSTAINANTTGLAAAVAANTPATP